MEENDQRSKNKKHKITNKKNIDSDMMQTESNETNLTKSLDQFGEELKFKLAKMHEQFKIKMEKDHANKLAKEIRDVYC